MKKLITTILFLPLLLPGFILAQETYQGPSNVNLIAGREKTVINWINPNDENFSRTFVYSYQSPIPIEDYYTFQAIDSLCDKIYEGRDETFTASGLAPNLSYSFILFSVNQSGIYSDAIVLHRDADLEENITINAENKNTDTSNTQNVNSGKNLNINGTLAGVDATVVNEVSFNEAEIIYNFNRKLDLPSNSESKRLSLFIMVKSPHDLNEQDKNAISYFIDQGTPTTILLGAGERTGVLNSYLSVFNKLPRNVPEWQDVIKISNGRWPNQKNTEAEEKAANDTFSRIYERQADMDNSFDSAAVTVIAYGLRPADRNLESEKAAIKIYESIFQKAPVEAYEWDMVRAIAYSGATR